ncbi:MULTISPECIES: hypothetical protein [unclassified Rathayibacter]|uniref:hypothetical protein n=1 Tax=unclassified Rathayibacter TaxID=2609250 RepID=UPI001FB2D7C9|nr:MULTISPECIES: hypothetical protein [unclassified Rathayibacter]
MNGQQLLERRLFDPVAAANSRVGEQCPVVRVPQTDLEVTEVVEQLRRQACVPLVEGESASVVAPCGSNVFNQALDGEPVDDP